VIGGRPLDWSADITKYAAAPVIATSASRTPTRSISVPPRTSSSRTRHGRDRRADEREPAGALAVGEPHPQHHGDGRGVLDQQRDADVEALDRHEVEQLRADHRGQAVEGDRAGVREQQAGPPAHGQQAGDREDRRGQRDAHREGGAGGPAGVHQAARHRAGRAERQR